MYKPKTGMRMVSLHRQHLSYKSQDEVIRPKQKYPPFMVNLKKPINLAFVIKIILILLTSLCIELSHQQSTISLNNAPWFVSNSNNSLILPAQVPGGIYSDLRRNQVLKQEILYGRNDIAYRWVGHENWTYTTSFAIDQQIAMSQSVKLVFHGLDTIATISLNGEEIGTADNMFLRHKFDVKPHLKLAGLKNILVVKFLSPIKYAAKRSNQSIRQNRGKVIPPYCPSPVQRGECHVNFIRKMQASFSWDWGPAFPSMGIYKNVELEYGSFGIIRDILVETRRIPPSYEPQNHHPPAPPAQIIISSNIKHNVRHNVPTIYNKTVPYMRAPPYYVPPEDDFNPWKIDPPQRVDITLNNQKLMDENWLLKVTLVAEMVQPSFGYNVRVEFNLNGALHYESEHINVVANPEGFIRLGFNLRIDTSRMQVKPWWPNNAGGQTLYLLSARMMPIPNAPDRVGLHMPVDPLTGASSLQSPTSSLSAELPLQARAKPPQTPAMLPTIFLATPPDVSSFLMQQLSEKEIWFGFRTVELIQEPVTRGNLDDGLTFNFRVNGVDMFAMGSNWIPNSILPENSNDIEHIRYLLESAKEANMNMLRVWGGGIYESDEFYRLADQLGIMIWHDFMFACALYPVDDDFIASVRLEVEQQVQRLQYHPSIVLWAGNNENEMAIAGPWWPEVMLWNKNLRESYYKLYTETIRPIVQILDPTRPYVESSPSNGLLSESQPNSISRTPNDNKYGDVHHYDYLTDAFDWTVFPSTRFASEYGYQSYPSFNALTSVTQPADWKYPLSSSMLHRQHRMTGETEIKLQIKAHFNDVKPGGEDKFKSFLYLSQLTQAIAIKTETEFYRRNRFIDPETKLGKTMGALYWQLNDVWSAPTWSSIEYGGKWKMLHYFARRFFFPIHVIPYLVQPSTTTSSVSGALQQVVSSGSTLLSSLTSNRLSSAFSPAASQQQQQQSSDPLWQQQQAPLGGPSFVIDLVRDDMFDAVDSFNVTIRFYRWASFNYIWQDTVYVLGSRPQNVTRIYGQDIMRIVRQPNVGSLSSGVFQVIIEPQPRFGLSQMENYLMPVAPKGVTTMRKARITLESVQGPLELATETRSSSHSAAAANVHPFDRSAGLSAQAAQRWACAYRLTLVSDSIAMFVWLDLNLLNLQQQQQQLPTTSQINANGMPLPNIHLNALPSGQSSNHAPGMMRPGHMPPEHIRLNQRGQSPPRDAVFETSASETVESKMDSSSVMQDLSMSNHHTAPSSNSVDNIAAAVTEASKSLLNDEQLQDFMAADGGSSSLNSGLDEELGYGHSGQMAARREKRQIDQSPQQQHPVYPPERFVLNIDNNQRRPETISTSQLNRDQSVAPPVPPPPQQQHKPRRQQPPPYRPVDAYGGNMLRFKFSDNAFNMFEPSRVIDLYLSRCLSKAQVELALEIQSMADSL